MALWEVDSPGLLALKEALRAQVAASPRCNLGTVAADLTGQLWPEQLRAAGFDGAAPSAWLAEGLLQYLETTAAVSAALGGLAAPGSHLGLDVQSEDHRDLLVRSHDQITPAY